MAGKVGTRFVSAISDVCLIVCRCLCVEAALNKLGQKQIWPLTPYKHQSFPF